MFVTASFAHVCVHIFVHFPLCIMVLRGDLTLSGGSGQINDHVHLPLRLQVNLCRGRKKETRVNQQEITRLNRECGTGAVLQHKQTHQCTCKRSLS